MRSLKSLPDAVNRAGPAAAASYSLIGAVVLLGGAGYGLDWWLGTTPWGVLGGLLLGMAFGFYELVMSTRSSATPPGRPGRPGENDENANGPGPGAGR